MLYALIAGTYDDEHSLTEIIADAARFFHDVVTEEPPTSPSPTEPSTAFRRIKENHRPELERFLDALIKARNEQTTNPEDKSTNKRTPRKKRQLPKDKTILTS